MDKFGLIGRTLKHSFSKYIHEGFFGDSYNLFELEPNELSDFISKREFQGVNVTIPYKQDVIPMLDYVDENAKEINAVNTIVNRNGLLSGYNTDYLGLLDLIKVNDIEIENKNVLLLGNGGTSNTARYILKLLKAKSITVVSRSNASGTISFEDANKRSDIEVIVNTTPVGMYPNNEGRIICLDNFPKIEAVVDVIYNPIRTMLCIDAKNKGIKYAGGLYMLVSQAIYARELFHDIEVDKKVIKDVFKTIKSERENIVLIGMPTSGKTTIAKLLKEKLNREVIDSDDEITKRSGLTPNEFITSKGIIEFRKFESEVIKDIAKQQGVIISTGGGVILNKNNMDYLSQNGVVVFIDRPLELLGVSDDRPLSSNRFDLEKRYKERYKIYKKYADIVINNNVTIEEVVNEIVKEFTRYEEVTYR
ncbi:MAG: shikimate dehydrogenase [Bacilli bacterium]|nr:shikimate dehydrogenase [Bacilli bacterium]